jgi:hypothetical protein
VDHRTSLHHLNKRKFFTLPRLVLRPLGRPARNQSLYRLRCPGSQIANRTLETVAKLNYLGTSVTDENLSQEEIKRRQNLDSACYHSVQKLSSCRLLAKT